MAEVQDSEQVVEDSASETVDEDLESETEESAEEGQEEAAPEASAEPDPEPDEVIVTVGDEAPQEDPEQERAPAWVRELRKQHRELQRKVKEYEERERAPATPSALPALKAKPKLEDHDYDTDQYETALEAWYRQRDAHESAERKARETAEEQDRAWKAKLDAYGKAKADLKVRDFEEAEHAVLETLSVTQQGVVLQGSENPALLVYALGKNPKRAKELAAVTDPVRFAFAVAKLEAQLKVQPRAKPPAPEKTVPAGSAPVSGNSDATLERLREEASKTGDFTKVIRFKQQMKAKSAK
jgi:hypothetical protein